MSSNPTKIPDAWDDDWEKLADKQSDVPEQPPEKKVSSKVTKAQRRAAQAEFNRQLWAEAESAQTFHFLETKSAVPLKQDFKPAVTVLSRRPQIASRQAAGVESATAGLARLGLNADGKDLSDSEEEETNNKPPELTPEERQAKALRDLEEKQRKYEEVRERLFGSSSNPGSGTSSTGSTTPPPSRHHHHNSGDGRGRGRNRGGARDRDRDNREKRDSPGSSGKSRQLYDPNYSAKPNSSYLQRRERPQRQSQSTDRSDSEQQSPRQPTRSPRGPDGSGRGGFGFGSRGRGA
ncbi:hypothetical protein VTN96DRAFT_193 [Rasamsonia emersonii]